MSDKSYIFSNTQATHEKERLEAIQSIFDPATKSYLKQIGVDAGWTCLAVGAGAGSIRHWLCDRAKSGTAWSASLARNEIA